jgi:uncharacterized phage protein (TIGR02218 family)
MIFIDYDDETLALLLATPNWSSDIKLQIDLPFTLVQKALSARESRGAFATSSRYSLEYEFFSEDAKQSSDLRLWLNRLKDETVAVPMWADGVELTASVNAGATLLLKRDNPVQYGGEWIVLSDDASIYEIVVVSNITDATITVQAPGLTLNWPAGTMMFPLLFGRIAERPQWTAETDELLSGTIKIKEDSEFSRRLNVYPVPNPGTVIGGGITEFGAIPVWSVQPNHVDMLDTTEVDLLLEQIGFGRQQQAYAYQQPVRRGMEMEFLQADRTAIGDIVTSFVGSRGPVRPFLMPTFRGDLRLAANASAGLGAIVIEFSRYSDTAYADHPGAAYLALVDATSIEPIRATVVAGNLISLQHPISQTHKMADTKVSHLVLGRFAEPTLLVTYHSDGLATIRGKVIEVPDEYATPNTELPLRARLFKFTQQLPTPQVSAFTSYEDSLSFASIAYAPAAFEHGAEDQKLKLDKETLELTTWDFPGNPIRKILDQSLEAVLWCDVWEVSVTNPNDGTAELIFGGEVRDLQADGKKWTVNLDPFGRLLDQPFPRLYYQKPCNTYLFSAKCGLSKAAFKWSGTIASITDTTVDITHGTGMPDPSTFDAAYFSGGFIEVGTAGNFERRTINQWLRLTGGNLRVVLLRPLRNAVVGESIGAWPNCNGDINICISRFNNLANFRGFAYIPVNNPSANTADIQQATGGKKGVA